MITKGIAEVIVAVIANLITKENNSAVANISSVQIKQNSGEVAVNQSQLKFPFTLNISS